MIMLITNNVDSAVIFKDLTVNPLNSTIQPPESNEKTANKSGMLIPYVSFSILVIATFVAEVVYIKKKIIETKKKQTNNLFPNILQHVISGQGSAL
jgi:Na+/proline symporter